MQIVPLLSSTYGDLRLFIFREGDAYLLALYDPEADSVCLFKRPIYSVQDAKDEAKSWLVIYLRRYKGKQFVFDDMFDASLAWTYH